MQSKYKTPAKWRKIWTNFSDSELQLRPSAPGYLEHQASTKFLSKMSRSAILDWLDRIHLDGPLPPSVPSKSSSCPIAASRDLSSPETFDKYRDDYEPNECPSPESRPQQQLSSPVLAPIPAPPPPRALLLRSGEIRSLATGSALLAGSTGKTADTETPAAKIKQQSCTKAEGHRPSVAESVKSTPYLPPGKRNPRNQATASAPTAPTHRPAQQPIRQPSIPDPLVFEGRVHTSGSAHGDRDPKARDKDVGKGDGNEADGARGDGDGDARGRSKGRKRKGGNGWKGRRGKDKGRCGVEKKERALDQPWR